LTSLTEAIDEILVSQAASKKPLAIVLAGHNGSGKSTMWRNQLQDNLQIPLLNADRMMLSILPEIEEGEKLVPWAEKLRDKNKSWMKVAQASVGDFIKNSMTQKVPFAVETVFSHWVEKKDGSVESKIDLIREMQANDYFVLLIFVGLSNEQLSIARVSTRRMSGGHDVPIDKLMERFSRTQKAINVATKVADAVIMVDNSLSPEEAFSVCSVQIADKELYDCRWKAHPSQAILDWLNIVKPITPEILTD